MAAALFMAGAISAQAGAAPAGLDGWTTYSQRAEIAPRFSVESSSPILVLAGRGDRNVDGQWRKTVAVEGGRTYRFTAAFRARNIDLERRSVLVCIEWQGPSINHAELFDYPPTVTPAREGRPGRVEGLVRAPDKATSARLELILRWDGDGEVAWSAVRFEPADSQPRPVRLATIYCRPRNMKTPAQSVEEFARLVREAASQRPDFICLPEGITVIGTPLKYVEVAEPVPGPTTARLGELAREARAYIVAGLYERVGPTVFNTAVLIDREGRLAGKYRKVALPNEEIEGGITPGEEFPVFDTDRGKVGLMICWDVFFPEPARALGAQGAEIIFLPIWGGNQTLIEARAIENQAFLLTSSYDAKTAIYDREGKPLAVANTDHPIAVVEVDLAQPTRLDWIGHFRNRIPREGPPVATTLK
jgi:predicted amidohydrolase